MKYHIAVYFPIKEFLPWRNRNIMYYLHSSLILKTKKQRVINYLEITGCDHYAK